MRRNLAWVQPIKEAKGPQSDREHVMQAQHVGFEGGCRQTNGVYLRFCLQVDLPQALMIAKRPRLQAESRSLLGPTKQEASLPGVCETGR